MESYAQFCSSHLARLQAEGQRELCCDTPGQQRALSLIRFHGRAVLSPVLDEEQRREMAQYRQRAAQLDTKRQSLRRASLLARVQDILDGAQVRKVPEEEPSPTPPIRSSPKPESPNGFVLLPNMAGPPWGGRVGGAAAGITSESFPPERETPCLMNGTRGEAAEELGEGGEEEEGAVSLQSLLKRSREYMEREQVQRGSWGSCRATPVETRRESLSDKENDRGVSKPDGSSQSPLGQDRAHPGSDANGSPNPLPSSLPFSLTGPYARLPSPEPSLSPRPHRRRPRPVSAGNILISFPACASDQGRVPERGLLAGWGSDSRSSDHSLNVDSLSPPEGRGRSGSHSGVGASGETVSPRGFSHVGQDGAGGGFRRRCQTLDSQLYPGRPSQVIDRSQERVPRFMGGLPWKAPCRRSPPAPLNQSYDVESPTPSLTVQRPQVARSPTATPTPTPTHSLIKRSLEMEGRLTLDLLTTPPEQQDSKTGEAQWEEVQVLEDMRRQLEEEHALQLSLLIAEQEREQQHLQQELEERERRLRDQGAKRASAGDMGAQRDSCPALSPATPALNQAGPTLSPAERSPGPVRPIGFPSSLSSSAPSPGLQPPVYLWGPSWGASKTRGRLSQDTQEFIRSFQTEAPQRRGSVSAQDLSLQERVRAQLRAALFDVHDIFFEMPLGERLSLLQQDRELRLERKLREMEKAKSPRDRVTLSAATQKSLDRKKRGVVGSPGQAKRMQQKPKSPPTNRVLQPSQGQNAPVPGQLLRQGSLYRKTPEERVKHSDSLRRQQSLG
ncbi:hypothetical protein JZ751_021548 [Albula glossodonta]|uniref:Centriolar coiled coil protein 110kDa n=1 Tax=Albula glossodonta TaxID=121402 RepID=A0A8T2NJ56_9TELE|nr:hypothetical protein JZ751_021548 [Albula glossodonta]